MGWAATYGGAKDYDSASIQQTRDGGCIMVDETKSFGAGKKDLLVSKLKADGTIEWQKTYGGDSDDWAFFIGQTHDGGYIVSGGTKSFGGRNGGIWVLKLRPDGTVEWQKTYGGDSNDWALFIRQTYDGGYIMAGGTESFGAGKCDVWVLKLRADGTIEWQKTYGGDSSDWAFSIRQTHDGGYIVSGGTTSFGDRNGDIWVLKLRPDGTVEWQKTYGGDSYDWALFIRQTDDGGYIVSGKTKSFGAGEEDLWVLKLKADGTIEWQKTFGGNHDDAGGICQQTDDGGYIVSGWTNRKDRKDDLWISKLRPDGSFVSAQDRSIDPACESVKEANISVKDSNATVKDTTVSPIDSNANPQDSSAIVQDTNAPIDLFCPPSRP